MKTFFIKENGEIKEVVLNVVDFAFDQDNNLTSIDKFVVTHQGEQKVAKTLYSDKECQKIVGYKELNIYSTAIIEHGLSRKDFQNPQYLWVKVNGGAEQLLLHAVQAQYDAENGKDHKWVIADKNGNTYGPLMAYSTKKVYQWFEDTIIRHNDGTTEVIKAEKDKWEFTSRQNDLIAQLQNTINELRKENVTIICDTNNCDVVAVRTDIEGYDVAFGSTENHEQDAIEYCHEWDEVPSGAYVGIKGIDLYWYGDAMHYKAKEVENKED